MSMVRLVFDSVSEVTSSEGMGILLLTDEGHTRMLSIICDEATVYQFRLRVGEAEVASRLAPEVLWQVITRNLGEMRFQVVINDLVDGQYKTLLYMPDILQAIPIRASDGVLIAYLAKLPIFIEERLMDRQSVPFLKPTEAVPVPVNILSNDMLRQALQRAVNDEEFEKASEIRDELRRRERKNGPR